MFEVKLVVRNWDTGEMAIWAMAVTPEQAASMDMGGEHVAAAAFAIGTPRIFADENYVQLHEGD